MDIKHFLEFLNKTNLDELLKTSGYHIILHNMINLLKFDPYVTLRSKDFRIDALRCRHHYIKVGTYIHTYTNVRRNEFLILEILFKI